MATVHTQYGPGRIIASETVRGQRQFKVAGEGFEVWLDEAKIGGLREDSGEDRPQGWFADEEPAGAPRLTADELVNGAEWPLGPGYDRPGFGQGDIDEYGQQLDHHGYTAGRLAWAPLDDDNSTELPYNPDPQHDAIGSFGDDGSSTIQPIHHIDADERLHSSDSISFEDEEEPEQPGPNPDLFARSAALPPGVVDKMVEHLVPDGHPTADLLKGYGEGEGVGHVVNKGLNKVHETADHAADLITPGPGWGPLVHNSSYHEGFLPALAIPALEALGGGAEAAGAAGAAGEAAGAAEGGLDAAGLARSLGIGSGGGDQDSGGEGDYSDQAMDLITPGEGWGPLVHGAGRTYEGLSDRYIDLTASVDYYNDPAAQFRHDPDAYINRIGHIMDEGLNPRFAEYMDLVEADGGIREAAWKDVRAKAMRLKREGHVHVKDIAPGRIMASVNGDHGTYDVTILKGATYGGAQGNSISNWHCACEWGRWAFRRKFTFVGRLCSHAYASYLTMQSEALKGQRPKRRNPSDGYIVNRPSRDQYLPTYRAAGRRQADNLQFGPDRLTPELVVNDTDDSHMFQDVTKDERKDVGPDDVVSEKDIVHFARVMAECERTERPYPRQLVSFLARYAAEADDTPGDFKADDAGDADSALNRLRADADRDQESDLGNMADRVHRIQDAVEEARDNGADASQFVAMVRKMAAPADNNNAPPGYKAVPGGAPGTQLYRENGGDGKSVAEAWGADRGNRGIQVGPNGDKREVKFDGGGGAGVGGDKFNYDGGAYSDPRGQGYANDIVKNFQGKPPVATPSSPTGSSDPQAYSTLDDKGRVVPKGQPQAPPSQAAPQATGAPSVSPVGVGSGAAAGAAGAGGAKAAPAGAGGAYTAPGGGQTSGTIADGGVAGAENGNNAAITKNSPGVDADGMYTVGKGDTWSDIAQRTTGDQNNYQKMFDQQKGGAGNNIDSLAEGTKINIKDFLNDKGNNGLSGDVTNPASGGADGNKATVDTPKDTSIGVDTKAASDPGSSVATPPSGGTATDAVPPPAPTAAEPPPASSTTPENMNPALNNPPAPAQKPAATASAKAWLRWAAEGDSSSSDSGSSTDAPSTSSATPSAPRSAPASNPASPSSSGGARTVGPSKSGDTYDPNVETPGSVGNPFIPGASGGGLSGLINDISSGTVPGIGGGGATSTPGGPGAVGRPGDQISGVGNEIGNAVGSFLPGIGGAISGISQGIGGLMNTFGGGGQQAAPAPGGNRQASASIFGSREDFDDWVRYAYPADMDNTDDPKLLPHHPFAGSGYAGPLEIGTSEEYAGKARKKHQDVTNLDYDVHADLGDLQKQGSYEDATDDGSDIVRSFQASMGGGFDAPSGGGRFDDFSGAAQGFLRTAGRNYSLAEQDELIREGDKGGARNLASLDLSGTHYEDMTTLGW